MVKPMRGNDPEKIGKDIDANGIPSGKNSKEDDVDKNNGESKPEKTEKNDDKGKPDNNNPSDNRSNTQNQSNKYK
jgi:hypothetical protein